ncbi:protein NETWORKED 4B-like [Solanum tuberosum]|uniref:RAB6-interacting protein n=2 Tax=Solanum tuberosum TaxID=4113 RepID=M1CZT8_SOLTU|nr:PREDICTED: protein NETWORKED 4B-like [Solanum tuberosum]XP_015165723.1 PREDICTED: protein NETWORKED 4B-like [Solanum tuberosum]KAH0667262.1 hypothetical protein KY285_028468 [Solanum tuberosum]
MESKKLQRPRELDSFLGPKNSKSQWLQDNLEEMNWNFRRMLKIIEDSNAESFAKKVEMYHQSRQELIDLVYKCYRIHRSLAKRHNHATGEPLINIPNLDVIPSQGSDIIISNVSSGKSSAIQSRPLLSKSPSSKQINAPECSVSKQLKRRVSVKSPNVPKAYPCTYFEVLERPKEPEGPKEPERPTCYSVKEPERPKKPGYLKCYVESQSDDDDDYDDDDEELQHEGTDELEAELCDMIEKLYIQMEGDRVVSMLQGGISSYEDNAHDDDEEFRQVRESRPSNVDKALLEENLELQAEIFRLEKDISSLEEYNEESNKRCQSLIDEVLNQAIEERIEAETLFASEVEQLLASIVKKNNDVEELNKILEAAEAERDQLKARLAMLEA